MKIDTFLVCDDIRVERDNRVSLMGLYDTVIYLAPIGKGRWSDRLSFSILLNLTVEDSDLENNVSAVELNLDLCGEIKKLADMKIDNKVNRPGKKIRLIPKFINFIVKGEGYLFVNIVLKNKNDEVVDKRSSRKIRVQNFNEDEIKKATV